MNYFLILLVIAIGGFAYYQHSQDEQQVTDLQQQITDMKAKAVSEVKTASRTATGAAHTASVPLAEVKVVAPDVHSSAIDQAAQAAMTASTSDTNNLGTINTLDGHTYHNCKMLKVEADGVTFSHDDGITKVLFPFLPPDVQKKFGYDPLKAAAQVDAQTRYDEQQAAATNGVTTPAANP